MAERLSTGLSILDRHLDGGVPSGSIVALVSPPESQSELVLDAHATAGPALYLTGVRPPEIVHEALAEQYYNVEDLDVVAFSQADFADPESLERLLDGVPERGYLIVDTAAPLETLDRERQREALEYIRRVVRERDAVCLFQCLGTEDDSQERQMTLHHADLVWKLDLRPTTLKIENRLYITKFRGGKALTEPVKLQMTDTVRVDTSRDI